MAARGPGGRCTGPSTAAPASVDTMCLSAHRKYALGSADPDLRRRALDIMRRAIDFAAEFGIRIVQVAGYDVHYEESTERTRALYLESILQSAQWARQSCVMLALENVECPRRRFHREGDGLRAGRGYSLVPDVPRRRQPHRHGEGRDAASSLPGDGTSWAST